MKNSQSKNTKTYFILLFHISTYIILALWFLQQQFNSSQQLMEISNNTLMINKQKEINQQAGSNQKRTQQNIHTGISNRLFNTDRIQVFERLKKQQPQRVVLAKTLVSQPTMTTQKIQTLMTGSQIFSSTSIIDAFFSSTVRVDNIITQANRFIIRDDPGRNGKTVYLGDDTWGKLFKFSRQYPCVTTFDIWDWDTCDQIIYRNLLDQINTETNKLAQSRYEIIIGHFLALDHIGHSSSSITHQKFKQKKKQISDFLQKIINKMDHSDLLMVTGDHGMRDDGNHGGSSVQESQSFLFAYSKSQQLKHFNYQKYPKESKFSQIGLQIRQPDITTTLSLVMNIPVPANSIGLPIFIPRSFLKTQEGSNVTQNNYIFKKIYQNLLKHFQRLKNFYNIQCQHLNQELSQLSSLNKLENNAIEYASRYWKAKQIQKECLLTLSKNKPRLEQMILILCLVIIVCLSLSYFLSASILQYIVVLVISIPHCFSWFLIRNSSTYYLISIIFILLVVSISGRYLTVGVVLAAILWLCQIESVKNGEYVGNLLRVQTLYNILISRQFNVLYAIIWYIYSLLQALSLQKAAHTRRLQIYAQSLIITIVTLSYLFKKLQLINHATAMNNFASIYLLTIIFVSVFARSAIVSSVTTHLQLLRIIKFYIIIFMGDYAIMMYTIISIIYSCLIYNYRQPTGAQIKISDLIYVNTIKNKLFPYACYVISHLLWWVLGNRYEYSSIDIKQSYIFSSNYHYIVNPICLTVYMVMPYAIGFAFMLSCHIQGCKTNDEHFNASHIDNDNERKTFKQTQDQQNNLTSPRQNNEKVKQKTLKAAQLKDNQNVSRKQNKKQNIIEDSIKFAIIPMVWLISCCINLVFNNEKILYTVVYVPMTVIQTVKIFILLFWVIVTIIVMSLTEIISKN